MGVRTDTYFHYDLDGKLIAETDAKGNTTKEYLYFGALPVALVSYSGSTPTLYTIQADHINTPRVMTDAKKNVVWQWLDTDPFGVRQPAGSLTMNLRFPGQYYDAETGLYHNGFRDYNPELGRYMQADPIGLAGGSWSTYAYVNGNPVGNIDPDGRSPVALLLLGLELYGIASIPLDIADGLPVPLGAGTNAAVFGAGNQVLKHLNVPPETVGAMAKMTNDVAKGFSCVEPVIWIPNTPFLLQKRLDGLHYDDLSDIAKEVAEANSKLKRADYNDYLKANGKDRLIHTESESGTMHTLIDPISHRNNIYDSGGGIISNFDLSYSGRGRLPDPNNW